MGIKNKIYSEVQLLKRLEKGKVGVCYVARNIYLQINGKDEGVWKARFQFNKKRFEKKLAAYGENNPYFMDYESAIHKSIEFQRVLAAGQNPLERNHAFIYTIDQLFLAYLESQSCEYKKEQDIYYRDIKPTLGDKLLTNLTRSDLEKTIKSILSTGRKSIARRALYFVRGLFGYANTHKLIIENVASHLTIEKHAGGHQSERQIYLTDSEIKNVFTVFQNYPKQAPTTNQIAIVLYLIFGFRKSELLRSEWGDFNFDRQEWIVKSTKMGEEQITLNIPDAVMPLFYTLKVLSERSKFLFPTVRSSKSGHLSESTLNAMLLKFFSEHKTRTVYFNNPMSNAGVRKFRIHDLRRTFTSCANDNQIAQEVTERCLNHKKRKRLRVYDLSNRQSQRKAVYEVMANIILPLANLAPQFTKYKKRVELLKSA